jgi:hypothetical protein
MGNGEFMERGEKYKSLVVKKGRKDTARNKQDR